MQVHRIYTFSELRNFSYLIEDGYGGCWCVDPFDAQQINQSINEKSLKVIGIINTHEHWDHTQGNEGLLRDHTCPVYGPKGARGKIKELTHELEDGHEFETSKGKIKVLDIPGHTLSHLGLLLFNENNHPYAFVSGDTIFNGGVGRCSNGGDPEVLYETIIQKIQKLSDDILLYPGHDYYTNNLKFTLSIEKNNKDALELLKTFEKKLEKTQDYVTNFGIERKINTFFRLAEPSVRSELDMLESEEKDVFLELRRRRDLW